MEIIWGLCSLFSILKTYDHTLTYIYIVMHRQTNFVLSELISVAT